MGFSCRVLFPWRNMNSPGALCGRRRAAEAKQSLPATSRKISKGQVLPGVTPEATAFCLSSIGPHDSPQRKHKAVGQGLWVAGRLSGNP